MNEIVKRNTGSVVVGPEGNPDGKGANGFMLDWYRTEPRGVVAKPQKQVLAEFFTSMLILSAEFKYKPAIGVTNYLYCLDGHWNLSLIAPEQWSEERRSGFVGSCELQSDMTWVITPASDLANRDTIVDALTRFFDAFSETLDTDETLEQILPFYDRRLPYWRRLFASAVARSVRAAVTLGGQREIAARDWRPALPEARRQLLGRKSA